MPYPTAAERRLDFLYHWQPANLGRLEVTLREGTIYCSKPSDFNDPWDCRPFFNTDLLDDPQVRQKHIEWAVDICRRDGRMSDEDIAKMARQLENRDLLDEKIREVTNGTQEVVMNRYRVYCMCPDASNQLMWAHYADSHRGICLEFNGKNEVICAALEVQYFNALPVTKAYSNDLKENLLPLLAKSDAWQYENEFRLVTQEKSNTTGHDTLLTENGQLKLPEGALSGIIIGCQGPYDEVRQLVQNCGANIPLRRAHRVENHYALDIRDE